MGKDWIQTLSNKKLVPLALTKEQVGDIREIAHALAGKVRFTCQTEKRYSVAEHCVRGAALLPPVFAGAFLLHELSEVYLPDIASPLKPYVSVEVTVEESMSTYPDTVTNTKHLRWTDLEREHTRVILQALGLSSIGPLIYSPEVKEMDLAMLAAEKAQLLGPEPEPWGLPVPAAPVDLSYTWDAERAEREFILAFSGYFNTKMPRGL